MESDPYHFEFGPPAYVLWHGYKWYYYHRTGYYRDARTRGLHVAIWEHFHQRRVPPGHDVHHMDEDKTNNAPGNLELKEHGKHVGDHNREDGRGIAGWTAEQFSESAKASWPRPEREFTCQQCGGVGRSSGQTPKYCSDECRQLAILARKEDLAGQYARTTVDPAHPVWSDPKARECVCAVCSAAYRTLAKKSKYCSPECLAKAMAQRRWTLTCGDCGAEFESTAKQAKFCPECRPKRNSDAQRASWAERQPVGHVCEHCGQPYESTAQRSKYCTIKCGDAARLERRIADQMSRA
jgi:hypothetical protein